MDKKIIGICLSCGLYNDLTTDVLFLTTRRCVTCRKNRIAQRKYASVLVHANSTMTQRELADVKRKLYETEKLLTELDKRKNDFIVRAMEEANKMLQEVEAQVGSPLKDIRAANAELKVKLKAFMDASGQNEMRIRDLLVTVKEEVINAGNKPLWKQIVEKMGNLLKWTEEELQTFIRANYSVPQYGKSLYTQFLPPGKRRKPAVFSVDTTMDRKAQIASIEKEWAHSKDSVCRVKEEDSMFIITGSFVEKHGLEKMIERQAFTKKSLSISDVEEKGNRSFVLIEGEFAYDPNTVRAFIADRFPEREISDVLPLDRNKIAVEVLPEGEFNPKATILDFFGRITDIIDSLLEIEQVRGNIVSSLPNTIARNQADLPDNTQDLSLSWEKHQPAGGNPGSFGNGGQEGIMSPSGTTPLIQTAGEASCQLCERSIIGSTTDNLCVFCEMEHRLDS